MVAMAITIETAADFLATGYRMRGHCNSCGRASMLSLDLLQPNVILVGPARATIRCQTCGSDNTTRTVVVPNDPKDGNGASR